MSEWGGVVSSLQQLWHLVTSALLGAPLEGWIIIAGLIAPIFVWSVKRVLSHQSYITRERNSICLQRQQLRKLTCRDQLIEYLRDIYSREDIATDTEKVLASLYWTIQSGYVDPEVLLVPTIQKWENGLNNVRPAPNWLLLSGLLGTVVGLSTTIGTLSPQISSALLTTSPEQATKALSDTLSSMQSAFACTLWGILTALTTSWLIRRTSTAQGNVVTDLQHLVIHEVAPRIAIPSENVLLQDLREAVSSACSFLSRVASEVATLSKQFKVEMEQITQFLAQQVNNLHQVFRQSLEEAQEVTVLLSQTAKESASALSSTLSRMENTSHGFANDISNALQQLVIHHSNLMEAQKVVAESYENAQKRLEDYITKQTTDVTNLANTIGQTGRNIVAQLEQNTDKAQSIVDQLAAISHDLTEHTRKLQELENEIRQLIAAMEKPVPSLSSSDEKGREINQALGKAAELLEKVSTLIEKQQDIRQPSSHPEDLRIFSERVEHLRQTIEHNIVVLNEALGVLTSTLNSHKTSLAGLAEKIEHFSLEATRTVRDGQTRSAPSEPGIAIVPDEIETGPHTRKISGRTLSVEPLIKKWFNKMLSGVFRPKR
ncbi:MAG: hypothetical protein QXQ66_09940 [Candidatus Hadarchaeum sp.]|uniref:hypothetical protein n=1 Tax=Candidatus Hadarchaeum sp. TaxID=2883567 RepID=UPI00316E7AFD